MAQPDDWKTTDLCDAHADTIQIAEPLLRHFGGLRSFCGPISTIKTHEDNSLVRTALEEPGQRRVLIIDGGASLRCALLGDQLAELAVKNAWAGVIVSGCVRDSDALARLPLGVLALATHPLKSVKRNAGQRDIPVQLAGLTLCPGQWIYADADGLIAAQGPLTAT